MPNGDITTMLAISNKEKIHAQITSKEQGVLCGIELSKKVFLVVDSKLKIKTKFKDGNKIKKKPNNYEYCWKKKFYFKGRTDCS